MSSHSKTIFRCATWNARSILNKKVNLETLAYKGNLDLMTITETWLTASNPGWNLKGFIVHLDVTGKKIVQRGLYSTQGLLVWCYGCDLCEIKIFRRINLLHFCIYSSSKENGTTTLVACMGGHSAWGRLVILGDMNAHTLYFFPFGSNASERVLQEILEKWNLIIMNDGVFHWKR